MCYITCGALTSRLQPPPATVRMQHHLRASPHAACPAAIERTGPLVPKIVPGYTLSMPCCYIHTSNRRLLWNTGKLDSMAQDVTVDADLGWNKGMHCDYILWTSMALKTSHIREWTSPGTGSGLDAGSGHCRQGPAGRPLPEAASWTLPAL